MVLLCYFCSHKPQKDAMLFYHKILIFLDDDRRNRIGKSK